MMKILVTGKNGQVAQSLYDLTNDDIKIVTMGRPELDITDKSSVEAALDAIKPDIVVNAAAYTAVDKAEEEPTEAFLVNRDGARHVAEATAQRKIPVIQISTDYVFNGTQTEPYKEEDPTGPINVYGLSKLEGEWAAAAANPDHIILRTAWVYSGYGNNFVKTMLRLAQTHDEINVVDDQWGTPTSAGFIAQSIIHIAKQVLSPTPPQSWRGVFHITAGSSCNRFCFVEKIMQLAHIPTRLKAVHSDFYQLPAHRPLMSILNLHKLTSVFGISPQKWEKLLENHINNTQFNIEKF